MPPTHTSIRIPSEPRRPRRVPTPKKSQIEVSDEPTAEPSSAPLVEEKIDTPVSPPSSIIPIPTPPVAESLADLTITPNEWTRPTYPPEFSVVPDFPFVPTTMLRSSNVNQFSLHPLSILLPIASANG
jgi:hypothetical protein